MVPPLKHLFKNDRLMTCEEFNNTVGAGTRNVMNYNLPRRVFLNKINRNDGLDNYDQEKKAWGISKGKVS